MTKNNFFLFSKTNCPYENLAIENSLLLDMGHNKRVYFFYKNRPSIVMGRFQNPWKECDLGRVLKDKDSCLLVRRQSGGGTVYHDLGNLNFCIIDGQRDLCKDQNHSLIIEVLANFGINAFQSQRSDLMVDYNGVKKISGSAFKQKKDSSFHHGTLLINSKLDSLNGLLKSTHKIEHTKSISSVSSPVMNLVSVSPSITDQKIYEKVMDVVVKKDGNENVQELSYSKELISTEYVETLKSWPWLIGETPWFKFEKTHENGFSLSLEAKKGIITSLSISAPLVDQIMNHNIFEVVSKRFIGLEMKKSIGEKIFKELFDETGHERDLLAIEKMFFDFCLFV